MKQYLLFQGDDYYPNGGWEDFAGDFDTTAEAAAGAGRRDWWQIVDFKTGTIVYQFPTAEE